MQFLGQKGKKFTNGEPNRMKLEVSKKVKGLGLSGICCFVHLGSNYNSCLLQIFSLFCFVVQHSCLTPMMKRHLKLSYLAPPSKLLRVICIGGLKRLTSIQVKGWARKSVCSSAWRHLPARLAVDSLDVRRISMCRNM